MIVAASGRAGVGKDEFCNIAVEEFEAIQLSFAGGLKEEVIEFLTKYDIPFENRNLYGTQKDKEELFQFHHTKDIIDNLLEPYIILNNGKYCSFRSLLQVWGTEYRRAEDSNYWVKQALAKCSDPNQLYVISDCRFKNEAQGILDIKGSLVRIERPNGINISNMSHPSEIDLDDWQIWHHKIINNGTLNEYREKCRKVLKEILDGKI